MAALVLSCSTFGLCSVFPSQSKLWVTGVWVQVVGVIRAEVPVSPAPDLSVGSRSLAACYVLVARWPSEDPSAEPTMCFPSSEQLGQPRAVVQSLEKSLPVSWP